MIRLIKALFNGIVPLPGVSRDEACRELFSLVPHQCGCCRTTTLGFYYDLPDWYRSAARMGPYHNDLHCVDCHKELMNTTQHCPWCGK